MFENEDGSHRRRRYRPHRQFIGAVVPNWLMERQDISPGAKLCFGRLCQYAGTRWFAFPHTATIARELGVGERHVGRYVRELVANRFIEVVRTGRANRYYFLSHPTIRFRDAADCTSLRLDYSIQSDMTDTSDRLRRSQPDHIRESGRDSEKENQKTRCRLVSFDNPCGYTSGEIDIIEEYHQELVSEASGWLPVNEFRAAVRQAIADFLAEYVGSDRQDVSNLFREAAASPETILIGRSKSLVRLLRDNKPY